MHWQPKPRPAPSSPARKRSSVSSSNSSRAAGSGTRRHRPISRRPRGAAKIAVQAAEAQLNKPYQYAASGPGSFDCSGLTMFAWAKAGVSMAHFAATQYSEFPHVPISQLAPGDLVFFGSPIHHVGMFVGNGTMIEAPHTGAFVRYSQHLPQRLRRARRAPERNGGAAPHPLLTRCGLRVQAVAVRSADRARHGARRTGRRDPDLLVGFDTADDAAVYRLRDDLAVVVTTDFFTPIVDDPYDWGRIAATNALSDVYAMGGVPILALNLVAWPREGLDFALLARVLDGGAAVAADAGCLIAGGHSIDDAEPKYGLAVVGTVHPDAILTNRSVTGRTTRSCSRSRSGSACSRRR